MLHVTLLYNAKKVPCAMCSKEDYHCHLSHYYYHAASSDAYEMLILR